MGNGASARRLCGSPDTSRYDTWRDSQRPLSRLSPSKVKRSAKSTCCIFRAERSPGGPSAGFPVLAPVSKLHTRRAAFPSKGAARAYTYNCLDSGPPLRANTANLHAVCRSAQRRPQEHRSARRLIVTESIISVLACAVNSSAIVFGKNYYICQETSPTGRPEPQPGELIPNRRVW